ncbi:MAG: SDR family NAD(P)-dependent oxidoreductase [Deltaproteobacteria bacterium]|nr:SDR family NAD(P)-dependent oxidoreductase [Deltaproteobacteria bacterium]
MNKVVVISGLGAGMGYEVAKILAGKGMSIAGFDMDPEALKTVKKDLDRIGGVHYLEALDITNRPGILKFRDKVLAEYGHVDTVLSNVGLGFFGPFEEIDLEKAIKNVEINLFGAAALLQAFIPSMRERRYGKLVVMASMIGRIPFPFESIYVAGKFAVEGLVRSIRYELEPFGIKVALVEPSQVSSQFAAKCHNRPPVDSPYYDRVVRFSKQNSEILKASPTPLEAAKKIAAIVEESAPKLHNQLSRRDSFNVKISELLPNCIYDPMFLKHMDIKN